MSIKPSFLLENPAPQIKHRLFKGRRIIVWECKVKISSINGWLDNPRIELAKKKLLSRVGGRPLTQDEIFDLMKNEAEVKLKDLRDDILENGLREPLVLSYTGKLLDGNRRFFAIKYALEGMSSTDQNRQDLESVDAYILAENATEEDEMHVLIEENFSPSLKIQWPDYVKAMKVVEAYEEGLSQKQIAEKFNWPKSKIGETLRIAELIEEFKTFATSDVNQEDESGGGFGISEQEAETIAAKNYQYFNEAQKSFFDPLKTDFDFKIQFYKWIHEGKFSSFPEVRIAHTAWKHPEARAALLQSDPSAAKSAKAILDYNSRIVHSRDEAAGRIENFVKFLREMPAGEIKMISPNTRANLEQALELVIKMSKVASKQNNESED